MLSFIKVNLILKKFLKILRKKETVLENTNSILIEYIMNFKRHENVWNKSRRNDRCRNIHL